MSSHFSPYAHSTSAATMDAFTSHFPERLGACIMLNPPSILEILLAVMRPLLDARTLGKAKVVRADSDSMAAALAPHGIVDPAQLEFLRQAIALPPKAGIMPDCAPLKGAAEALTMKISSS